MKILVLSRFRPGDPDGGAALRNLQNIYGLSLLGSVDVVSLNGKEERHQAYPYVRDWKHFQLQLGHRSSGVARVLQAVSLFLGRAKHFSLSRYWDQSVARWLHQKCREEHYDLVVVEELSLAHYLPVLRAGGVGRLVLDAHNVEGVLRDELDQAQQQRHRSGWRERKQADCLYREESRAVRLSDQVWACSEVDAQGFERLYQSKPVVIPNGIRVQNYQTNQESETYAGNWSQQPIRLLFLGSYAYFPNEDAALCLMQEVLPELRKLGRKAEIVIVGRGPTPAMIEVAKDLPEVEVTGGVESVLPYLEEHCIACLPIRLGSGTRLKILEAFAAMRPVVSSPKGAEGILVNDGEHLALCEKGADFAEKVIRIWDDQELRERMCLAALELARSEYSWESAAEKIALSQIESF